MLFGDIIAVFVPELFYSSLLVISSVIIMLDRLGTAPRD